MNRRPIVFEILSNISGEAADHALIEGLSRVSPEMQSDIIQILLNRGHESGLQGLAAIFDSLSPSAQAQVVSSTSRLFGALRTCMRSSSSQTRQNTLKIVRQSGNPRLAYLAGHAIHDGSPRVRGEAATTLLSLTDQHCRNHIETTAMLREAVEHDGSLCRTASQTLQLLREERQFLITTLREVSNHYESHHRPEVLEASMLLAHEFEGSLFGHSTVQRATLIRTMINILGASLPPRFAPFVYVAMCYPELRRKIVPRIAACHDSEFFTEFIQWHWLTRDPRIRKHLVAIRKIAWLESGLDAAFDLPTEVAAMTPAWLLSLGLTNEQKVENLKNFLIVDSPRANRAAAWALTEIRTPTSTTALEALLDHEDAAIQNIAKIELDSRCRAGQHRQEKQRRHDRPQAWSRLLERAGLNEDFNDFWRNFEQVHPEQARIAGHYVFQFVPDFETEVRLKLASTQTVHRIRSLRLITALSLCEQFQRDIFACANDKSAEVRTAAIVAMGRLGGETSRRILERALNDERPVVQAAAIDALDRMEARHRSELVAPKTESEDADVRAAAVRCLLKMQEPTAVTGLFEMLQDARSEHRCAALWIADELKLTAILSHIIKIAQCDPDRRIAHIANHVARRLQRFKSAANKPVSIEGAS